MLDSGEDTTHAVPIYEGFALQHACRHLAVAGRHLTDFMIKSLARRRHVMESSAEREIVREMKEMVCKIETCVGAEEVESVDYILPNDQVIRIQGTERVGVPEILFQPDRIGIESSLIR